VPLIRCGRARRLLLPCPACPACPVALGSPPAPPADRPSLHPASGGGALENHRGRLGLRTAVQKVKVVQPAVTDDRAQGCGEGSGRLEGLERLEDQLPGCTPFLLGRGGRTATRPLERDTVLAGPSAREDLLRRLACIWMDGQLQRGGGA
jgi:hypothetical protein